MPAWGARSGVPARGCAVGASAAPSSADFDPPWRTAPAGRGPRATVRPPPCSRLLAGGHADHRPRVTGGRRGPEPCPRVLFPCPFRWRCTCFRGSHRCGAEPASRWEGGGPRHPAPSRAQEGGREHPRRGRPPGPLRRPAVERARKLLSAARWTNFSRVLGLPFLLPSRPAAPSRGGGGGGGSASRGRGPSAAPPTRPRARPPAPPPHSRSLRKLRP